MRALTWQGNADVRIEDVPDPTHRAAERRDHPGDVDRDLRLGPAPVRGARPLPEARRRAGPRADGRRRGGRTRGRRPRGRRPCGRAVQHLLRALLDVQRADCMAQCETTQVRAQGKGASLFGYTSLYGSVPGGQAEYLRVPQAQFGPIKVPEGVPDERCCTCPTSCPTAWQAVEYADVPAGGTVAVLGLGPVGLMAVSIAVHGGRAGDRRRPRAGAAGARARRTASRRST